MKLSWSVVIALLGACSEGGDGSADATVDVAADALDGADDAVEVGAPCDPVAQDCARDKCAVMLDAASETWATLCVAAGARDDGQTCTRGAGPGDDDCVAGAFCTFYSVLPPVLGGTRVCREHCTTSEQCAGASGDVCVDFGSGLPSNVGLCVPSCAPFEGACGAGLDCSQPDRDVAGRVFLYCRPLGVKALGEACDDGDAENVPGCGGHGRRELHRPVR